MKRINHHPLSLLTLSIILVSCEPKGSTFENAVCIENVSIIDAENGQLDHQTVIIQNGKISKVSPTASLTLSKENNIIDGNGKYLIPGLWDAHVHFAYIEELAPSMFDLFLGYGITSVRDTGGRIDFVKSWKEKALENPTDAPRLMIAGPLLDGLPNVYDGSDPGHPPLSVGLGSVDDVIAKVNELETQGIDLLKAYEMLSEEQFITVAKMGKEKGLKVTGHVPLSMDVMSASNAGLNSMEHMRNLELSCASNADELLRERIELLELEKNTEGAALRSKIHQQQRETAVHNYDENKADEILATLAKNDTWQIPTLTLNTGMSNRHFSKPALLETFKYLPDSVEKNWKNSIASLEKMEVTPFQDEYAKWSTAMVGKIHAAEIPIMAGTDTPIFFLTPGYSLHEELVSLVKAGLSPIEAIKSATVNPAKYFKMENELGLVKENMWADLILLDANPLEDINNTKSIHTVIKQGKVYHREELDAILERH